MRKVFNCVNSITNSVDMNLDDVVDELKKFELVHSILLFGSTTKKSIKEDRDIDIYIIEKPQQSIKLKEKLGITRNLRENMDVSFFHDLPLKDSVEKLLKNSVISESLGNRL